MYHGSIKEKLLVQMFRRKEIRKDILKEVTSNQRSWEDKTLTYGGEAEGLQVSEE